VHHALKFRAVQQIERMLFSGKHIQSDDTGFRNHTRRVFGRQIAAGDRFKRELDQNAKPADATALVVNFFLRRSSDRSLVHGGPVSTATSVWTSAKMRAIVLVMTREDLDE